mmetsp:Transcript_38206/g.99222  ORF Transcript_38206/g.99222 Transcript_38206/m.99222 type:complete len:203 (-) Transcript_38206:215-823(-)
MALAAPAVPRPCSMVHMLPHRQAWHRRTISSRLRCARSRCCVWPPPHRGDTPHRSDTALCSACCPRRPPPAPTISCRSATRGSAIVPATAYPVNNARTHMPPRPPACGAAGSLPARLATGRGHSRQRAPWPPPAAAQVQRYLCTTRPPEAHRAAPWPSRQRPGQLAARGSPRRLHRACARPPTSTRRCCCPTLPRRQRVCSA